MPAGRGDLRQAIVSAGASIIGYDDVTRPVKRARSPPRALRTLLPPPYEPVYNRRPHDSNPRAPGTSADRSERSR
jgi:hypothetical protein